MKITFVYPDVLLHRPDWTGYFYVGIASLSTVLKKEGHDTSLIHITKPVSKSEFVDRIRKENPDLIGFSSTSPMFPIVKQLTSWLAEDGIDFQTICGGIHPTIAPEEAISAQGIDMICRGEGEAPMMELCRRSQRSEDIIDIPNLWIKKDGYIQKNPLRPLMDDLDKLPFPDRSVFDYQNLYAERQGRLSFLASRGCPYNCAYCCNHLIRRIYGSEGKTIRFRSVDNVISEIKYVIKRYPFIRTVNFDDDILFLTTKWAEEFTERYSAEIGLPFICNARANLMDKAKVGLLKKAGCFHVKFGLESGNEYISNNILDRQLTNDQVKKAFALCRDAGLITESFNMVGIPFETPAAILDTIKLNASIGVNKMQVSIYQPYQGTRLADVCRENNFVVSEDLGPDWFSPTLKLNTISSSQVLMFRDYFRLLVRFYQVILRLPGGISRILTWLPDKILSLKCTARILNLIYIPLNHVYRKALTMVLNMKSARVRSISRSTS
jgi:radical SAM superfamily enzyme YgiQ (UPF0313 family)